MTWLRSHSYNTTAFCVLRGPEDFQVATFQWSFRWLFVVNSWNPPRQKTHSSCATKSLATSCMFEDCWSERCHSSTPRNENLSSIVYLTVEYTVRVSWVMYAPGDPEISKRANAFARYLGSSAFLTEKLCVRITCWFLEIACEKRIN